MIDALLYAARDAIRGADFGYSEATCDIMADGMPPAACGDIYVAVHQTSTYSDMMGALNEFWGFFVTLTMRFSVPVDRVGDKVLASKLARQRGPNGQPSFNARAEQLRAFLHMDWGIIQDANNNLVAWSTDSPVIYGFCEPAAFKGMEAPVLVGGEWFSADPAGPDTGLKAELRFEDARRLQAIAHYV